MDQQSWEWIVAGILILLVILAIFIFPGKSKELFGEVLDIGKEVFSGEIKEERDFSINSFKSYTESTEKCLGNLQKGEFCGCKLNIDLPDKYYIQIYNLPEGQGSKINLYVRGQSTPIQTKNFNSLKFGLATNKRGPYDDFVCDNFMTDNFRIPDDRNIIRDLKNNVYVRPYIKDEARGTDLLYIGTPTSLDYSEVVFCFVNEEFNDEAGTYYSNGLYDCDGETRSTKDCSINNCQVENCMWSAGECVPCLSMTAGIYNRPFCIFLTSSDACSKRCSAIWGVNKCEWSGRGCKNRFVVIPSEPPADYVPLM